MEIAKKRMQTCCFTGHRELPPKEQVEIANRLNFSFYLQWICGLGAWICVR